MESNRKDSKMDRDCTMQVKEILKTYYGFDTLRKGQESLINAMLEGKDALGIMPTGAGKSLCYQVPALMMNGITLVISPLISLMTDQVRALNQAGVHAAYINSALSERQIELALSNAAKGTYTIIYVAPERLLTSRFLQFAVHADIAMVAVDEAHCISQWGQDFRPSYLEIAEFLKQLPDRPVVSAFTATATSQVKDDIVRILELKEPELVITGFDRPNLFFKVITRKGGRETDNSVLNYVMRHSEENGIIYCATRKNVEKIHSLLLEHGIQAGKYHAGMDQDMRKQMQEDFSFDRIRVMVATNAFGMGIDKSNVRYVLHYNMPQSIEYYYQEAGRAGRDGEEAECVLFFSRQDIMINRRLIDLKRGNDAMDAGEASKVHSGDVKRLNQMIRYCETDECLRQYILDYFGEKKSCICDKCSNCVSIPEEEEEVLVSAKTKHRVESVVLELSAPGQALFEKLRAARSALASEQKVPPFIICSDKTLKDMCVKLPKTSRDMLDVYGMGANKVQNYGESFLKVIREFPAEVSVENGLWTIEEKTERKRKEEFWIEPDLLDTVELPASYTISEVAKQLNELKEPDRKNITAVFINSLLQEEGYLLEKETDGKKERRVSEKGFAAGMSEEKRTGRDGSTYYAILHNAQSKTVILNCIRHHLEKS